MKLLLDFVREIKRNLILIFRNNETIANFKLRVRCIFYLYLYERKPEARFFLFFLCFELLFCFLILFYFVTPPCLLLFMFLKFNKNLKKENGQFVMMI